MYVNMCMNQQYAQKILVIRLYFLLDALHVLDCISPSSGATFISCTSHIPAYIKCYVQLVKVAPDDGLIQSETCTASNRK